MPANSDPEESSSFSRRTFVTTSILSTAALIPADGIAQVASSEASSSNPTVAVSLHINKQVHNLTLEPRVTLLDTLRERLGYTGVKKGCDHGQCGACTVLVNSRRINSCLSLAVMHQHDEITTVEGLVAGDQLHPVQAAYIEYDGFQCGYCTPGQICSTVALIDEVKARTASAATPDVRNTGPVQLTDDEIRERMSGNICRCGAYPNIIAAVRAVLEPRRQL